MSITGLDSALSGLSAAQQQLSVIASNVSNASTPGYTEKILPQTAQTVNGVTVGVTTDPITRNVNLDMEKEFWTQQSAVSGLNTTVSYLNQIQQFNGPPDQQADIGASVANLQDAFSSLADDPSNSALQTAVVTAASNTASKLNDFSGLITQMRNDTQTDMQTAVSSINSQLQQIANLNGQIKFNLAGGQTVAALQDTRDSLVSSLSQEMGISTFTRADGVLVVQTTSGVQLADETPQTVTFQKNQLSPTTDSTGAAYGIYVGDPTKTPLAINIANSNLGGQLGALVTLRDTTLPQQQASLDELSEQLAQRFSQQGLTLFTNPSGNVPANTAPSTATNPATPVPYVGFAANIEVNPAVTQNNALVQSGTAPTDTPNQTGSSQVIERIIDYTFGATQTQEASGTVNLNASAAGTDLQSWLGLYSNAQVTSSVALSNSSSTSALAASDPSTFNPTLTPPTDQFTVNFAEARTTPPTSSTIAVSLSQANADFPVNGTTIKTAADQMAAEINKQAAVSQMSGASGLSGSTSLNSISGVNTGDEFTVTLGGTTQQYIVGANAPGANGVAGEVRVDTVSDLISSINSTFTGANAMTASLGGNGQLVFSPASTANGPATFTDNTGSPTTGGLSIQPPVASSLGVSASVSAYGQLVIQSRGNVTIGANGTGGMSTAGLTDLGLTAGTTTTTDPYITVQIGNNTPVQVAITPGEDETGLVAALNQTSPTDPGVAGLGVSIDPVTGFLTLEPGDSTTNPTFGGGLTIVGGPFQTNGTGTIPGGMASGTSIVAALFGSANPVADVPYASTNANGTTSPFRQNNLGPGANISTGLISNGSIIDYAQQLVSGQAAQYSQAQDSQTDEATYSTQLQTNLQNSSGVNIDEELSNMVVVQTAYSAAARVISAIDQQFQDLLNAFPG